MADLQKTGVEAVVEGLASFKSDVDELNGKIGEIGAKGNILTRALVGAWDMLQNLGASIVHVAEYALGQLLADAIEFVITKLGDLISETIEAGSQFQLLQLRLERLNFNSAIESGMEYNEAMEASIDFTKEQLDWVQKLAVQTPYDFQDVANVFTLAQGYGFAADEAKTLTESVTNFASGMGLGNTEIERIIINFGQMVQQGKLTGTELKDLARGAFVPVNDILDMMKEKTGLTGKAFDKFRKTGASVGLFMESFVELVDTRFQGASEKMAQTFEGATANAKDFAKSLIGFGVVRPILGALGESISGFVSALTQPERWEKMTAAAGRVGEGLADVVRLVQRALGLDPSKFADALVGGLEKIASWIENNRSSIYQFFKNDIPNMIEVLKTGDFKGGILGLDEDHPFILGLLAARTAVLGLVNAGKLLFTGDFKGGIFGLAEDSPLIRIILGVREAFLTISDWVSTNGPLIGEFFLSLGNIIGGVFDRLTEGEGGGGFLEGILEGVSAFMQYVVDNQETITNFVTTLVQLWGILQVIGFVFGIVSGVVMTFIGFLISLAAIVAVVIAVISFLLSPIGWLTMAILLLIAAWNYWGEDALRWVESVKASIVSFLTETGTRFGQWVAQVISWFGMLGDNIHTWLTDIGTAFGLWFASLIAGISSFVSNAMAQFGAMYSNFITMVNNIISKVKNAPWQEIGASIIKGMIMGIASMVGSLVSAVGNAVTKAVDTAKNALKDKSPSRVFWELGANTMEGMALGITRMAGMTRDAMERAMSEVAAPAISLAGVASQSGHSVSNTTTNNFGLTIHSGTTRESILQDYGMLQSLAQG